MPKRKQRRQPQQQSTNPDLPIFGAENIARMAGLFREDGEPDTDKIYNGLCAGYFAGLIHKNGRILVTTLRQIQQIGQRDVTP